MTQIIDNWDNNNLCLKEVELKSSNDYRVLDIIIPREMPDLVIIGIDGHAISVDRKQLMSALKLTNR